METTETTKAPREGSVTKMIESYTSEIPSGAFLGLAIGGIALSALTALVSKQKGMANFIGLWVPTILLTGIYNKLVKLEGSDRFSKPMVH
jgi:hypothetical protein